jgi:hypothetical protein
MKLQRVVYPDETLAAQVLTVACILMWLTVAALTIKNSVTGKMFYAPCLGTDLFAQTKIEPWDSEKEKDAEEKV